MVDVAAGFDDLWALDASKNAKYTHISALNEKGSGGYPSCSSGTARTPTAASASGFHGHERRVLLQARGRQRLVEATPRHPAPGGRR